MVPLLELQRRQQIATLYFSCKGPSLLKCSMVAPEAFLARGDCFIKIPQYTQVLSLARISRSTWLEIPYVLDMDFSDLYIRHFDLGRLEYFIAELHRLIHPTANQPAPDPQWPPSSTLPISSWRRGGSGPSPARTDRRFASTHDPASEQS
jgi:hypothetical protein